MLEAYYTGEMGGDAISSVLLGDVSPSGRLTTTIYHADYIHQSNITDMVRAQLLPDTITHDCDCTCKNDQA